MRARGTLGTRSDKSDQRMRKESQCGIGNACVLGRIEENCISRNPKRVIKIRNYIFYVLKPENRSID